MKFLALLALSATALFGQLSGYSYRATVTINSSQITGTLTDYILTVSATSSALPYLSLHNCHQTDPAGNTLDVPCDVIFVKSDGTTIAKFYWEEWTPSTGAFTAKVLVSSIADGTSIYIDYGNNSVTTFQGDVTGTFPSRYVAYLPLGTSAGVTTADFTGNNTTVNTGSTSVAGKVGAAAGFNGSSQFITGGAAAGAANNITVSGWAYFTSAPSAYVSLTGKRSGGALTSNYGINFNPGGNVSQMFYGTGAAIRVLSGAWSTYFTTNTWYMITAVYEQSGGNTNMTLYKNGTAILGPTAAAGNVVTNSYDLHVGAAHTDPTTSEYFPGRIDDFWITNTAVTGAYLTATYKNQNDMASFLTITYPSHTGPAISGLTYNASASTIWASWTSDDIANTGMYCGTVSGGPYSIFSVAHTGTGTSHYDIVAGLSPSTSYFCKVRSGVTFSSEFIQATSAAASTTAITDVSFVGHQLTAQYPTTKQWLGTRYNSLWPTHWMRGDTFYNTVCANGTTYLALNDSFDFDGAVSGGFYVTSYGSAGTSNVSINTLAGMPLVGTLINPMTGWGYGNMTLSDGNTTKEFGVTCLNDHWQTDILYMPVHRQSNTCPAPHTAGGMLKSTDYGVNWANWTDPSTTDPNGAVTTPLSSNWLGAMNNPSGRFSTLGFVMYEPGNSDQLHIHNQDAYVYLMAFAGISATSQWANGTSHYLIRIPRSSMPDLDNATIQYYIGGDGMLDAAWSTSSASASALLTDTEKHSAASVQYIPTLNRYIMLDWYYPLACAQTNYTMWVWYESPYPWGPWTPIYRAQWIPSGWYNPIVLQSSASTAALTATSNTIKVIVSGDFGQQSAALNSADMLYQMAYFDVQLQAGPRLRFGSSSSPGMIPKKGLVGAWDMHPKGSLSTVSDLSGYGRTATDTSNAGTYWGALGYRMNGNTANGLNTTLTANPETGAGFGDMTIAIVYQADTAVSINSGGRLIAQMNSAGTGVDWQIQRNGTTAGVLGCGFFDATPTYSSAVFTEGDWHLVVCRRNGTTGLVELMRNGATVVASKTSATTTVNTTGAVRIGYSGVTTDQCNCSVNNAMVWNRMLTDVEIGHLYQSLKSSLKADGIVLP